MVAIRNAIVLPLLLWVIDAGDVQKECILECPANGSRDIFCDAIPYRVDLSNVGGTAQLDVSRNNLDAIYIGSDKNVTLSTLDLSGNNIRDSCRVLASGTVTVRSTILSFNKITNFSVCLDTRNLTLSWNHIKSLNKADTVNVSSLEVLNLGYNFILWIENDTFVGMPNLQWLDLKGNTLAMLSEKTLPSATLLYLDVSDNYDLDPSTVFEPFENLVELNIAGNVDLAPVVLGSGPRLQALDASRTNLTQVPVTPAPLLGSLVLSGNAIRTVNSGDLDGFPLLRFLNISGNRIGTVEDDAFGRLDLLTVLDLCGNLLETVPKSLPGSLETLNLEDNKIQRLEPEDFDGCKRLKILNVRKNGIRHIGDFTFASLLFLDVLDISENPIKMITREMLTGPVRLKVLKLEALAAPETPAFPFTDTRYLNRIQLARSKHLAAILLNDSAVLSSMFQLDHLDLTGCAVRSLPARLPYYMPKMKTLMVRELECSGPWLKDWLCELQASAEERRHYRKNVTELRLRNYRPKNAPSPLDTVECTQDDGETRQSFDPQHCAAIVTTPAHGVARTTTTEQAAVFARLRAKDQPKNTRAAAEPAHPGMIVFVCAVLLLVVLASGTVWIGIRGNALKRLQWGQNTAGVDYQTIEIKSLESLNHVERW